ncbi:hypothetical protein AB0915_37160, partial [Streptomyces sp. NPDC048411]
GWTCPGRPRRTVPATKAIAAPAGGAVVAALLGRVTHRPGVGRAAAAALLACLILSGSAALEATNDLHSSIEIAQGEVPQH